MKIRRSQKLKSPLNDKEIASNKRYNWVQKSVQPLVLPIIWMVIIRLLSSEGLSGESTSRFIGPLLHWVYPDWNQGQYELGHLLIRKLAHIVEFTILCGLWIRSLTELIHGKTAKKPTSVGGVVALSACISIVFACFDEFFQSFTASRSGQWKDVLIDGIGVSAMVLWAVLRKK